MVRELSNMKNGRSPVSMSPSVGHDDQCKKCQCNSRTSKIIVVDLYWYSLDLFVWGREHLFVGQGGGGWPIFSITFSSTAHKYTSIATRNRIKTDATRSLSDYISVTLPLTFFHLVCKERGFTKEMALKGKCNKCQKVCRDLRTKVPFKQQSTHNPVRERDSWHFLSSCNQ